MDYAQPPLGNIHNRYKANNRIAIEWNGENVFKVAGAHEYHYKYNTFLLI